MEKTLMLGTLKAEEKEMTEDEMLDGITESIHRHEFEQTQGDSGGQRSLTCRSSWGHKESDKIWQRITLEATCISCRLSRESQGFSC